MAHSERPLTSARLTRRERWLAAAAGLALLALATALELAAPSREVVIDGCTPSPGVSCTAHVDGDFGTFAAVLVAAGGLALLIGLLGIRFTTIRTGGVELSGFDERAKGLAEAAPEDRSAGDGSEEPGATGDTLEALRAAARPMSEQSPDELNAERSAIYARNHGLFLSHVVAPSSGSAQRWRTAIFVVGHGRTRVTRDTVESAWFFLGERWGSRPVRASWSDEGELGIRTEAYGPFLVVCEVTLKKTGERVRIDHYVDVSSQSV
jgi:hypothetical protein